MAAITCLGQSWNVLTCLLALLHVRLATHACCICWLPCLYKQGGAVASCQSPGVVCCCLLSSTFAAVVCPILHHCRLALVPLQARQSSDVWRRPATVAIICLLHIIPWPSAAHFFIKLRLTLDLVEAGAQILPPEGPKTPSPSGSGSRGRSPGGQLEKEGQGKGRLCMTWGSQRQTQMPAVTLAVTSLMVSTIAPLGRGTSITLWSVHHPSCKQLTCICISRSAEYISGVVCCLGPRPASLGDTVERETSFGKAICL